jgi:hypothetical protein
MSRSYAQALTVVRASKVEILASSWEVGPASEDEAPCDVGKGFVKMLNSCKKCQIPS